MKYLDDKCKISFCENNRVNVLLEDGTELVSLEPRRMFPISSPNEYITFLDEHEKEVCRIKDYSILNDESRNALLKSFSVYYFVPEIKSVEKMVRQNRGIHFFVTTDHGKCQFFISNPTSCIKKQQNGSLRFRDTNDNRYIISDPSLLDRKSRNLLFAYI